MNALGSLALAGLAAALFTTNLPQAKQPQEKQAKPDASLQLGNFCISLNVKDVKASKAFYEKLDFKQTSGKVEENWVVMMNGTTTIGLFQGMFEKNMLTFNPGWDWKKEPLQDFQDVRELQRVLKARGVTPKPEADEATDGPAFFMLEDPDGNPILVDQIVSKPKH